MQRAPGQADPTHEYVVLGTKRLDTMEEEFRAAAANGFKLVGQSHYNNPSATAVRILTVTLGAAVVDVVQEMLAVLERPLQQVAASGVRPSTTQVTASRLPVNAAE